ncbi:MAG: hypothetical protein OEM02_00385 [Desulfobulbaceae bacterium]|nr:hypothetical protein [Desulfobulbaceae bacterium]
MTSNQQTIIAIDGHVHLHDSSALAVLLDQARSNFLRSCPQATQGLLLLTQTNTSPDFKTIHRQFDNSNSKNSWTLNATSEPHSWKAIAHDGWQLWLITGRQLVSSEGLEVLIFGDEQGKNGMTTGELINTGRATKSLVILPWGVGKWLGNRGKIVSKLLAELTDEQLILGDNGARPALWHWVKQFSTAHQLGIRVLRGTDSLPLSGEINRVGSFGAAIQGALDPNHPTVSLLHLLADPSVTMENFGNNMGLINFICKQIQLRFLQAKKNQTGERFQ